MEKVELLSPAGDMESLYAAINAGADAVYLGGTLFSARAFAGNFTNDELEKAVEYSHLYGVKVYVTCNILVYEHEVDKFMEYIDFLHRINVDAVLIQDLGMLDLVHKTYPNLEIHASTQMHIHNLDGTIMAHKLGCKRVVLARETCIDDIREIVKKAHVDIEVFAHGSLCVSYSGQCLFSSLIGKRSGNRGSCVGSCRLPYKIVNKDNHQLNQGDYPLSMKDLNTLEYLKDLIEAGISSLKIEGRMKSPEYVYTVTKLYRTAIDSYYVNGKVQINQEDFHNLQKIFSRGYTKGYLFNEKVQNILNTIRPNHQGIYIGKVIDYNKGFIKIRLTSDVSIHDGLRIVLNKEDYGITLNEFYVNKKRVLKAQCDDVISLKVNKLIPLNSQVLLTKDTNLIARINEIVKSHPRKVGVRIKVSMRVNQPLEMLVNDGTRTIKVEGDIVEKAYSMPLTKEDILLKMQKIGDTIYKINDISIDLDNNAFISFKNINELRHVLFKKLDEARLYKTHYIKNQYTMKVNDFPQEKLTSVLVNEYEDKLDYDIVYSERISDDCIIKLPKVMHDYNNLDIQKAYLVGELGAFNKLSNIYTDYSLNVVNSYTVALLHHLGSKRVTLSLELSDKQIDNLVKAYVKRYQKKPNLEVIMEGFREVMTLKTNLNKYYQNDDLYLVDRFNNYYKIRSLNGLCYIYEPKKYSSSINFYSLGINVVRCNKEV